MSVALATGLAACLAWGVLLFARGGFWRLPGDDGPVPADPASWPAVLAVVPARDEAATIGVAVASLLAQDYPGRLRLVVVDDRSADGTADLARAAAGGDPRLAVVAGGPRAPGWTGKLWALRQGLEAAAGDPAPWLLLTDADIRHAPDSLRRLVAEGEARGLALNSRMVRLRCQSPAERWLVPAFVFFFALLYPFAWVNDPRARTAGAAGGCMLVRRAALAAAGGLEAVRGAMIDDCALAARLKRQGPIRLTLGGRAESLRAYEGVGPIRAMVARTAYAQLRYSPALLAGTLLALALVFLAPPLLALGGAGWARAAGLLAWGAMAAAQAPVLRRYGLSPWHGLALPLVALAYMGFTLDSALAERRGRGGMWKGESRPRPGVGGPG